MPLADVVQAALSRPVARVIEGPVRQLLDRILEDHGYATPDEVDTLSRQLREAEERLRLQEERIGALEGRAAGLEQQLDGPSL